jgi:hypothetical protein
VRFKVLMALSIKMMVFCDITLSTFVDRYEHFGGIAAYTFMVGGSKFSLSAGKEKLLSTIPVCLISCNYCLFLL